jgi:hypothetical protein
MDRMAVCFSFFLRQFKREKASPAISFFLSFLLILYFMGDPPGQGTLPLRDRVGYPCGIVLGEPGDQYPSGIVILKISDLVEQCAYTTVFFRKSDLTDQCS